MDPEVEAPLPNRLAVLIPPKGPPFPGADTGQPAAMRSSCRTQADPDPGVGLAFCGRSAILEPNSFEEGTMCDYSLAGLPNRLAVEGDQLVVQPFSTGAMGLAPLCPSLEQHLF